MQTIRLARATPLRSSWLFLLLLALPSFVTAQVDWSAKWIVQNRSNHAMAYDAARQRLVLFGGETYRELLGDTWEWDGTDWHQVFPPTSPSPRRFHAMTYDAARGVVVLFGGEESTRFSTELWEWDGSTWTPRTEAGGPPSGIGSQAPMITYDAARQRVVVLTPNGSFTKILYEWDGTAWTTVDQGFSRAPSSGRLVYDSARQTNVISTFDSVSGRRMYLWDGTTLALVPGITPPTGPFVDDPLRGRVIAYSGTGPLVVTEWDGVAWTPRFVVSGPNARVGAPLAFDAAAQRVVLVGGQETTGARPAPVFDTWEWDGIAWRERVPFAAPPAGSFGQNLAYDSARDRTVYFGAGTWEWNGDLWEQKSPAQSPPARTGCATAYAGTRARVVLFGGLAAFPVCRDDLWLWDGTSWTEDLAAPRPAARFDHALAYDSRRDRVVLFGGRDGTGHLADTWEWDITGWQQRTPVTSPPARSLAGLAYDALRGTTVLFGGTTHNGDLHDTWEWDGTTWTPVFSVHTPVPRSNIGLTFDAARGRVVMFGGSDSGKLLNETWEWDGIDWLQRTPVNVPAPRIGAPLAYDSARREILTFGGFGALQDLWHYAPISAARFDTSQTGCPGSAGTPTLSITGPSGYPWLGAPFAIEVRDVAPGHGVSIAAGVSSTMWGGASLPLALDFVGMFGCQAYCSADLFFPVGLAGANGIATWNLGVVPNDPRLLGVPVFVQAWIEDAVNPTGLVVSNLGAAIAGAK